MQCFSRYFGLIIGDLVPAENECWQLYLYLRKIIDIVTSPRVLRNHAKDLKYFVKKLCSLYIKYFDKLKPKFHNLLHYPRILLLFGPLVNFWTSRCESKHQPLKAAKTVSKSSKNSLKTIATKEMLAMCERSNIYCNKDCIQFSAISKISHENNVIDKVAYYSFVEIHGTRYTIGTIVLTNLESNYKKFGKVERISKKMKIFPI